MAGESQVAPAWLHNLMRRLARWFVAGVLVILAVAITVAFRPEDVAPGLIIYWKSGCRVSQGVSLAVYVASINVSEV